MVIPPGSYPGERWFESNRRNQVPPSGRRPYRRGQKRTRSGETRRPCVALFFSLQMPKITVTLPDGQTAQVEPDALALPEGFALHAPDKPADGYVTAAYMAQEIQRRSASKAQVRNELKADDAFRREIAGELGVQIGDDGKAVLPKTGSDVDLAALKQQWQREELEPVKGQLSTLQRTVRNAQLVDAARQAGLDERFLTPVADGADPLAVSLLAPFVKEDDEGRVFVQSGGVPVMASNPQAGDSPYASLGEAVKKLAQTEGLRPYLKAEQPQRGSGYSGTGGKGYPAKRSEMSTQQKVAYVKEHGSEAFASLPA